MEIKKLMGTLTNADVGGGAAVARMLLLHHLKHYKEICERTKHIMYCIISIKLMHRHVDVHHFSFSHI